MVIHSDFESVRLDHDLSLLWPAPVPQTGLNLLEMMDATEAGSLKALWSCRLFAYWFLGNYCLNQAVE